MSDEVLESLFKNKSCIRKKLQDFGFASKNGNYTYTTQILNAQFLLTVEISKSGKISTELLETPYNEKYVLHLVPSANGAFVGKIKSEYARTLAEIADRCFVKSFYKSQYAQKSLSYIKKKYGDAPEHLWAKSPSSAILRRKDNKKWYATLLLLSKRKLGLDSDEKVEVLGLKVNPEISKKIIDNRKYFLGFHMNKKYWISIILDGSVPTKEIYKLIDQSYNLADKK